MLALKIVALGPIHGYAIAQRINQISREVLKVQQGSLYPALHRLEKRGLLSAKWREVSGREAGRARLLRHPCPCVAAGMQAARLTRRYRRVLQDSVRMTHRPEVGQSGAKMTDRQIDKPPPTSRLF